MNKQKYDAIFMIGPQGSGKGTQGKTLAEKVDCYYWGMGAILREVAKEDTPFGHKVKDLIDAGKLLSDEDLFEVWKTVLPEATKHRRILFDGVPRTVPQAIKLVDHLKQYGFTKFGAIHIDVPREESVKRLLERAHRESRADDTPEKIGFRLDLYNEATKPVIKFLENVGDMNTVNGVGTIEEVTERIDKIFNEAAE